MNKNSTNETRNQLENLMRKHTQIHAERPMPTITPVQSVPVVTGVQQSIVHDRFTLRLCSSEKDKLSKIILEVHQKHGLRLTAAEVWRVAFARVGENSPVTPGEIAALRQRDGRRHKHRTVGQ